MDSPGFWDNVAIRGAEDCWPWLGATNNTGYGTLEFNGMPCTAHRVSAYLCGLVSNLAMPLNKTDPYHVLHRCDYRACCHPGHFFTGSQGDNMRDMYAKGRHPVARGENHTNAKLSVKQVMEIRALYAMGGVRQKELAARYGVSQGAISHYVTGKNYK
jgi:predicted XRE-type DNA-binding protein